MSRKLPAPSITIGWKLQRLQISLQTAGACFCVCPPRAGPPPGVRRREMPRARRRQFEQGQSKESLTVFGCWLNLNERQQQHQIKKKDSSSDFRTWKHYTILYFIYYMNSSEYMLVWKCLLMHCFYLCNFYAADRYWKCHLCSQDVCNVKKNSFK